MTLSKTKIIGTIIAALVAATVLVVGVKSTSHLFKPSTQTMITLSRGGELKYASSEAYMYGVTKKIKKICIDVYVNADNTSEVKVTDNGKTSTMTFENFEMQYKNVISSAQIDTLKALML